MSKYISRQEAANRLRCSDQTVSNWVEKGILKARKIGRALMLDADTIEVYADTLQDIAHTEEQLKDWQNQLENKWRVTTKQMRDLRKDLKFPPLLMGYAQDVCRSMAEVMMVSDEFRERESAIFAHYIEGETMEEIAEDYGLNRERVRQILAKVIRKFGQVRNYKSIVEENDKLSKDNHQLALAYSIALKELEELRKFKDSVQPFVDKDGAVDAKGLAENEETMRVANLLTTEVTDLNISLRALNCLKAADIDTLGDLVQYDKLDLLKFRNFGKKSLSELDDLLEDLGLKWNMNVKPFLDYYNSVISNKGVSI